MQLVSKSYRDTIKLGRAIAAGIRPSDIICLYGQLGAGKTVLVKGIAQGLGLKRGRVLSPSFTLMRCYEKAGFRLYHFDLYRLNDPREIAAAGFEEYLYPVREESSNGEGAAVIEWADRLKYLTPKEFLKIELSIKGKESRFIKLSAEGVRYKQLLRKLDENISR